MALTSKQYIFETFVDEKMHRQLRDLDINIYNEYI